MKNKSQRQDERRRANRTVVQESFSLFLVIPQLQGMSRIYLKDISRMGLRLRRDSVEGFSLGLEVKARLYLSPAIYLPLDCKVVRVEAEEVALQFPEAGAGLAIAKLQEFFEAAEEFGVLVD